MHDPKFESAVQEKMEHLEFIPSDSVWENIEMAVAQRRRRAVPVFVWFLSAGLLLAGAGTAIYLRKGNQPIAKNISGNSSVPAGQLPAAPGDRPTSGSPAAPDQSITGTATIASPADAGFSATGRRHLRGSPADVQTGSRSNLATPVETRRHFAYHPGLLNSLSTLFAVRGSRLAYPAIKTAVTGIQRPKRPWAVGFAGGLGVSSYNQSLLGKTAAMNNGANAVSSSSPSQYLPAAIASNSTSSKRVTSTVQPGLSYWAGIAAQKPISARWTLSLGLDLHYYSSSLRVGGMVTTYARSSSALIGSANFSAMQSYPYYSVGDVQVFTNRYYYLELPVAMQWQINRGRVVPLFLRGGVTLSRLMSSDGLYYDDESAVYYKNNAVIQPMQVSLTSGLAAALPLRWGVRIQAGPEVQYGATNLLKGGAGNGHLLYGGLRVTVMR